jgi:hypothetical protein
MLGILGIENRKLKIEKKTQPSVRADAPCFTLGNFKKDATVRLSHGRPLRPSSVRPSENVRMTTLAHTRSELDVLGVHGNLVKYVVHLSERKNWKKFVFLHTSCPNNNRLVFGLKEF